jgi:phosphopantetheine--protein transferase-like protein
VIGIDLVRVSDLTAALAQFGDRYAQRVFTSAEIGYCRQHPDRADERFAARFSLLE